MSRVKESDKPRIDLSQDNFGCILTCAVRYALGRQTYMPGLVVDFIRPLLPYISDKTLYVFDQDITDQKYMGGYGDKSIDEPIWMKFHQDVIAEEGRRGMDLYKDWRTEPNA